MKKRREGVMRKKAKNQFLKRPLRFMLRFDKAELREYKARAKRAGMSMVEYGRRKILDIPIAEGADTIPQQSPAEIASV